MRTLLSQTSKTLSSNESFPFLRPRSCVASTPHFGAAGLTVDFCATSDTALRSPTMTAPTLTIALWGLAPPPFQCTTVRMESLRPPKPADLDQPNSLPLAILGILCHH
ncbi:hypothetical protein HZ326_2177 [Fusarium oxysporum f. sp. albedinis]|nr:hypothetical protein HZ326_2177 [Fusarium oxysporum f. sp. albedinis]